MHPSTGSSNPFSDDEKKVPKRCPLRRGLVSIRMKKEVAKVGKKKWTKRKLQQLLRLHEKEGLSLAVCARHFEVAATHLRTVVIVEAKLCRDLGWMGWSDEL